MEEKHRFISLAATGRFTCTELCADFGVSRKTGYKWWSRYQAEGVRGLQCRSRRPHGCAHQTAEQIERLILRERQRHTSWGPKKLRELLRCQHRIKPLPARSTIGSRQLASIKMWRTRGLPCLVIAPRKRRSPDESSHGTRPV